MALSTAQCPQRPVARRCPWRRPEFRDPAIRRPTNPSLSARRESSAVCSDRSASPARRRILVVDPLVADGVPDSENRSAENLTAKRSRVNDRSDVGNAVVIEEVVDAGLDIDFDFGERGHERIGRAVALVIVLRDAHEALTGKGGCRSACHRIDVLRQFVPVKLSTKLDRALRGFRQRHAGPATLARDALVGHHVVFRPARRDPWRRSTEVYGWHRSPWRATSAYAHG